MIPKTHKKDIVAQVLKKLADENHGILRPEVVVAYAKPMTSPIHSRFEWDNKKAGHAFRLWQARQLISVCVEIIPHMHDPVDVFVSLSPDRKEGGYRLTQEVLSDAEMRRQMLSDALNDLGFCQRKYAHVKELTGVWQAVRKARQAMRKAA